MRGSIRTGASFSLRQSTAGNASPRLLASARSATLFSTTAFSVEASFLLSLSRHLCGDKVLRSFCLLRSWRNAKANRCLPPRTRPTSKRKVCSSGLASSVVATSKTLTRVTSSLSTSSRVPFLRRAQTHPSLRSPEGVPSRRAVQACVLSLCAAWPEPVPLAPELAWFSRARRRGSPWPVADIMPNTRPSKRPESHSGTNTMRCASPALR